MCPSSPIEMWAARQPVAMRTTNRRGQGEDGHKEGEKESTGESTRKRGDKDKERVGMRRGWGQGQGGEEEENKEERRRRREGGESREDKEERARTLPLLPPFSSTNGATSSFDISMPCCLCLLFQRGHALPACTSSFHVDTPCPLAPPPSSSHLPTRASSFDIGTPCQPTPPPLTLVHLTTCILSTCASCFNVTMPHPPTPLSASTKDEWDSEVYKICETRTAVLATAHNPKCLSVGKSLDLDISISYPQFDLEVWGLSLSATIDKIHVETSHHVKWYLMNQRIYFLIFDG
ncbi:hypothetical protein BDQ12DRAFT_670644 [Crucibulum laeve]|uniref:Uncharacterized protein n=1 Tax=Crucibulum laeve TaxID=68775 RepID=A0A5C3LIS1_9AGAR|nr:hypothetical protein BDQ12DRAFT_670644 [Crucibulum laeve]